MKDSLVKVKEFLRLLKRECDAQLSDGLPKLTVEEVKPMQVRFRTIGDATCTGAVLSKASTLEDIIDEVAATRITERGGRADDKRSEAAMEDRKKQGYF